MVMNHITQVNESERKRVKKRRGSKQSEGGSKEGWTRNKLQLVWKRTKIDGEMIITMVKNSVFLINSFCT